MPIFGSKKQAVTGGTPTTNATTPQHSDTLDLKVICEPVHANIDVIALHGLGGGNESTWSAGSVNWLRDPDMLQSELPRARIMTYGYNANVALNTNQGDLRDQAQMFLNRLLHKRDTESSSQRPIIFIGHSLGGIVIKRAMITAFEDPHYNPIFLSSRAILFMGTPHRGSSKATLGKLFAHIASAVITPNKELLRTLEQDSSVLQDVTYSWKHHYPALQVASCYELKRTYLKLERLSARIVDRFSAVLEYPVEQQIPMDADHLSICKFTGPKDPNYTMIVPVLKNMAAAATGGVQRASAVLESESDTTVTGPVLGLEEGSNIAPQAPQLLLGTMEVSELEAAFDKGQTVLYQNGSNPRPATVTAVQNVGRRNESYQLIEEDGSSFQEGRWVGFQELQET